MDETDESEYGYTEWRCESCGRGTPRNNPPCNRCGNMSFERVEVHASDFDEATRAASTRELLRENARIVGVAVALVLVVGTAVLANAGVFVVADPLGLGYRYGAVDATPPDDDGRLTAAELHGRVAAVHDDTALRWSGRRLELSYDSRAGSNAALTSELVRIAGWYATYVDDGGDAARLRITAAVGERGRIGVTVQRGDAAAFAAGEITEAEYRTRILGGDGRA